MWPQIIMPKEAKLDEQEGLEWSWETGLCPWYFLVSSCWASHPWGLSLSHLLHPGKKGGGHKGAAPTFSGLPSCKGRKPRQTGCGTEGTPASGDSEGRAGCAWNFFFFSTLQNCISFAKYQRWEFFFLPQQQTHSGAITLPRQDLITSALLPKFWENKGELPVGESSH